MPPKKKGSAKTTKRPTLALLCGLPGCGKSTFSTAIESRTKNWVRVSPDDIGIMSECKKMIAKALKHGNNVLLDRTNGFMKERKMFIREVAEFNAIVEVVVFNNVTAEECIKRAQERKKHPTLDPENAEKVVLQFAGAFQLPERLSEGPYDAIRVLDSDASLKELTLDYLNR